MNQGAKIGDLPGNGVSRPPEGGPNCGNTPVELGVWDAVASTFATAPGPLRFALVASLAASTLGKPVHVVVVSGDPGADALLAKRIASLAGSPAMTVGTFDQARRLSANGYDGAKLLLVPTDQPKLLRHLCDPINSGAVSGEVPSTWQFTPQPPRTHLPGPALVILHRELTLDAASFGLEYGIGTLTSDIAVEERLRRVLRLIPQMDPFPSVPRISMPPAISRSNAIVASRIVLAVSALHEGWLSTADPPIEIEARAEDAGAMAYRTARELLVSLPLSQPDAQSTPSTWQVAKRLFREIVVNPDYQRTVPDCSDLGHKLFTRETAMKSAGCPYTTCKKHLEALVDEGVLAAYTVSSNGALRNRRKQRGVVVFYRFCDERREPELATNVFARLPLID